MRKTRLNMLLKVFALMFFTTAGLDQPSPRAELTQQTRDCLDCHEMMDTGIHRQWEESKHFGADVGCFECHGAAETDPDGWMHEGYRISVLVTPKDCGRCHAEQEAEFAVSRHSKGARIIGSEDNLLAEVVEGNRGMVTPGFPEGVAASVVVGCWQCHGSEVKVLANGRLDAATYPNSGIGRINPDGSEGACNACHLRHEFAKRQVRHPDTCGKCHMGPDHPQIEIYNESKHGIAFRSQIDKMNLVSPRWVVGTDYWAAPACATCHMSATETRRPTHDIGTRISWNNRPAISLRPEVTDAKLGLPGKDMSWQVRRSNMQDVCTSCHQQQWVTNFYLQYDEIIKLYHEKFAEPGLALYNLARPLLKPVVFGNKIDFTWFELWHHEGRRLRHGASMMGPDFAHWHGAYEVAKHFYGEYIPRLEELAARSLAQSDPNKRHAAVALRTKLDEVIKDSNHRWYVGKMDPAEAAKRKAEKERFESRYE